MVAALEQAGAPQDVIDAARARAVSPAKSFEVWGENASAVAFFCEMGTQWRVVTGMAGATFLGLDYQSVESAMRIRGVDGPDGVALFKDLRTMERAALEVLNRRK